jgi:cytochrome b
MSEKESIKVWDPLVRLFHWSLVTFFVIAFATHEDVGDLHIFAGYTVLGLVLFRIVWGFVGSRHARFSDFIYSPAATLRYLIKLFSGRVEHYLGHNPAGGWMVVALLIALLVVSYTGLKAYGVEGHGPLAGEVNISVVASAQAHGQEHQVVDEHGEVKTVGEEDEGFWHELHEAATDVTLALIFLHLLGVAISSRLHGEKLVKAMITGRKEIQ